MGCNSMFLPRLSESFMSWAQKALCLLSFCPPALGISFSWNGPYQSLLNLSVCRCFQAQSGLLPPAASSSFSGDRNSLSHHQWPWWHVCGDCGSQLRLLHQIPQWWTGGTSAVNTNFSPSWKLEVQDQGSWLITMSSHNLSLVCTEGGGVESSWFFKFTNPMGLEPHPYGPF